MRAFLSVLLAVLAITAAAPAAHSAEVGPATTWTVAPGGAAIVTVPTFILTGARTGATFVCSGSVSGAFPVGSGLGSRLFHNIYVTSRCNGPLGVTCEIVSAAPAYFTAISYLNGRTFGRLFNVTFRCTGQFCSFTATGTLDADYENASATFRILTTVPLTITAITGCYGFLNPGDPLTPSLAGAVNPRQVITSP
ncbi:MAG TPA: hypothetical protein VGD67_06250 [Pseudonocardiaceae bacterium]